MIGKPALVCSSAAVNSSNFSVYSLPMLEIRRPLLGEGAHALLLVFGREQRMEDAALEPHPFRERRLLGAVDGLLGGVDRGPRQGSD